MQPRPSFDRELLIPIAIGVVSILGIGWIFSTSSLGKLLIIPTAIPIPSSFSSLEAGTLTPSPRRPPPRTRLLSLPLGSVPMLTLDHLLKHFLQQAP